MSRTSKIFHEIQTGQHGLSGKEDLHDLNCSKVAGSFSELMTEEELIEFLRIPEVSNSKDFHNVIENLKRIHDLPRIYICGKTLFSQSAIREWIRNKTVNGR